MRKSKDITVKFSSPLRYKGNVFFLIFFLILWIPIGILLLLENAYFIQNTSRFRLKYHGCWEWLYFWAIILFPVAIALMVIKGIDIIQETIPNHYI